LDGASPPRYSHRWMIPERPLTFGGSTTLRLEAALSLPQGVCSGVAVCHPHPQYGGDMDSPVVVAAARAGARGNLAALRFNFRGVGASGGAWDEGRGEQDDVRAALVHLRSLLGPPARVALAGYSFGAAMAAAVAAAGEPLSGLALIAPPLAMRGLPDPPSAVEGPLLIVAGSRDTYCPAQALAGLAQAWPSATITVIDGADHFFFGGLEALDTVLTDWVARLPR
jgi:alpha/beta superfamily hydrolase